jgi:spore germination cell wall hydrolase CwlJ-like protein
VAAATAPEQAKRAWRAKKTDGAKKNPAGRFSCVSKGAGDMSDIDVGSVGVSVGNLAASAEGAPDGIKFQALLDALPLPESDRPVERREGEAPAAATTAAQQAKAAGEQQDPPAAGHPPAAATRSSHPGAKGGHLSPEAAAKRLHDQNVRNLAKVIATEAGGEGTAAMTAVGWTLRNRMIRNRTDHVDHAWRGYQHGKAPSAEAMRIAEGIIDGTIPDPTNGATHFYTPDIMRKEHQPPRKGEDDSGGLEQVDGVTDGHGKPVKNYRPGFADPGAKDFEQHSVAGVPEHRFKFYKQVREGHVR